MYCIVVKVFEVIDPNLIESNIYVFVYLLSEYIQVNKN